MKYPMSQVRFIYKNKSLANIALERYLKYLPHDERALLIAKLQKDSQYKKEFSERLREIASMLNSLFFDSNNLEVTKKLLDKLRVRERSHDPYIIDMYKNIIDTLLSDIVNEMDESEIDKTIETVEIILQDCPIYADLEDIFAQYD